MHFIGSLYGCERCGMYVWGLRLILCEIGECHDPMQCAWKAQVMNIQFTATGTTYSIPHLLHSAEHMKLQTVTLYVTVQDGTEHFMTHASNLVESERGCRYECCKAAVVYIVSTWQGRFTGAQSNSYTIHPQSDPFELFYFLLSSNLTACS